MPFRFARLTRCFVGLILLSVPAAAATIAPCNANFTTCVIPENIPLQLPFTAFAGDAIVTEPGSAVVSDVFRIFNNIINTGLGTGLGNMAFLYSADDSALPDPSPYSANALFLSENPSSASATVYFVNGTNYLLGAPEPQTYESLRLACVAMAIPARRSSKAP